MFGSLLLMTNLTQSNGSRTVFVRLHFASSGRSSLASCLGGRVQAAGAYNKKERVVGGRLLRTSRSSLLGRGQTPSNKVTSRHILKVSISLSAGQASEAWDPMHIIASIVFVSHTRRKGSTLWHPHPNPQTQT